MNIRYVFLPILLVSLLCSISGQSTRKVNSESERRKTTDSDQDHKQNLINSYLGFNQEPAPYPAYIFLKDGIVIDGQVVKGKNKEIKIITSQSDTLMRDEDEIKKIQKKKKGLTYYKNRRGHFNSGIFINCMSGNRFQLDSRARTRQLMIGYRHNQRVSYGIGLSLDLFERRLHKEVKKKFEILNPFLYGRFKFNNGINKLFVSARAGHAIFNSREHIDGPGGSYKSGFNFTPSIGVVFASKRYVRFVMELGMVIQEISGHENEAISFGSEDISFEYDLLIIKPMLKFGIDLR